MGLNERAWAMADALVATGDRLGVATSVLGGGTRVIDLGITTPGGIDAGMRLAEISMGGLGDVCATSLVIDGDRWAGVQVSTADPAVCCLASQYAGWAIQVGEFFAIGSGPLRAHARVERELFHRLGYAEQAPRGVLVLETRTPPTEAVAQWVADKARLDPAQLTLLVAPTASIAGSVQVAARVVETGLHKMDVLGFDVTNVVSASGTAPLAPVAKSDLLAIGRTNDSILYGGQARYIVHASDAELERLAPKVPASASEDYGVPFSQIFERYGGDFYKIDPLLFSPAEVWLTSAQSGKTHHAGRGDPRVMRASLNES